MKRRSLASPHRRRSLSNGLSTLGAMAARRRKLRLEPLESRLLLSTNFLVNSLADVVAADGFVTLREALQAANTDAAVYEAPAGTGHDRIEFDASLAGGTIELAAGLGQLKITDDLDLVGLGAADLSIDAQGNSRVFYIGSTVTDATISGLTITGGSTAPGYAGGGIDNRGTLLVVNSTISGNSAGLQGGGIRNSGTLTVTNSTLENNSADWGGGIYSSYGTLTVANSTFVNNSARTTNGGAIFSEGILTVTNSTLANNSAGSSGGGICLYSPGAATVTNCTLADNSAGSSGGGISSNGTLTVTNSTLANNSATNFGGGIRNSGTLAVTNSTLAGNSAGSYGGGIMNWGTLTLANSLLGANTAPFYPDLRNDGTIAGAHYNVIQDGAGSGILHGVDNNQVGVDPLVDPAGLQDRGGPTQTIALLPDSPAIDKGDDARAVHPLGEPLLTDQRGEGFARIFGDGVDVGAFERQPFVVSTLADEEDGDLRWGNLSLREALGLAAAVSGKDVIRFAPHLAGGTIELTLGELQITSDLDLVGLGAAELTIDAAGNSRVFYVANEVTDATISDLTITRGRTLSDPIFGAGILNYGTLRVVNSTISDSLAGYGGGIYNAITGDLVVENSTISGNSAGGDGGGISNAGTLSVLNSTIDSNIADENAAGYHGLGGGIYSTGTLEVFGSTISRNSTPHFTGGIHVAAGSHATVVNSTISGNSAGGHGGGIRNCGTLEVFNSTIAENIADENSSGSQYGGGVFTDPGAVTTLHNTIVARNVRRTDTSQPDDLWGNVDPNSSYNLVGDAATSGGLSVDNHNIVGVGDLSWLLPLGDYGGPTQTHALLADSPAIDAGDPLFDPDAFDPPLVTDQRGDGFDRVFGDGVDMGAFEFQLIVSTPVDEADGDYRWGYFSLREALALAEGHPGKDEIRFAPHLAGETIELAAVLGELVITEDLDLVGLGAAELTIDAAHNSRVFYIGSTVTDATISGLTITGGSTAPGYPGGGIYNLGTLLVVNSTISGNLADGSAGGGIRNSGTLTVTSSTFENNSADWGGGISSSYGTLTVANSTFVNNSARSANGGAIFSNGTLAVTNSTLANNSAASSGGGICLYSPGAATVTNCTLADNSAGISGGIFSNGTLTVTNSTLANNSASGYGGGIYNSGTLVVTNSTLADNSAGFSGGGIMNWGTLTLVNSLLGGNTAPFYPDLRNEVTIAGAHYNVIQDGAGSGILHGVDNNQVGVDPLLDPAGLQDRGGPTQTIALLPDSPAIDKGDDARALDPDGFPLTTDQRGEGFARISGDRVDIGAFERQPFLVSTVVDEQDGDLRWGDLSLREALGLAAAVSGKDVIRFAPHLAGGTIELTLGELQITSDLDLVGLGAAELTIDAQGNSRVFYVDAAVTDATISGLTITGGSAANFGGGILNYGTLRVVNSTISGNWAEYGGGVYDYEGTLSVVNSTISGNSASGEYGRGGGICSYGTLTLRNSIIALNEASDEQEVYGSISTDSGCNLIGVDPGFVRNPSPGADGTWGTGDDDYGDLRLTDHSPAIDMGNNAFVPPDLVTDLDGNPRIYGPRVDIGAYEFQGAPAPGRETPSTLVTTPGDVFDLYDGEISLREAIWYAAPGELVTFDAALDGAEIVLGGRSIPVDRSVIVDASGLESLVLNGDGNSRVFTVWAEEVELVGLTITGGAAQIGGGIYNSGTLTVTGSTISGNSADDYGGGILNHFNGTLSVVNSTIWGNSAETGGGIENWGMLSVVNSTISGNVGGGIFNDGTLSVVNSTISGNSADSYGGGILNCVVTVSVVNSTISGNSAETGGGIYNEGTLSVLNSTIVENTANADNSGEEDGGGIFTNARWGGSTTLHNTIVAGNVLGTVDPVADDLSGDDVELASSHNLVGDAASSGGLSDGDENGNIVGWDPLLEPLGNCGGPTQTHALSPDSPAIDTGDPEFDPDEFDPPLVTDQRGEGFARISGDRVDIGAYEFGAPLPVDFGDAPDSYSTLLASDGARHTLEAGGPLMGAGVDADPDGQPDADALGDDLLDGSDDEDGVEFVTPLARGQTADVEIDMIASPSDALLNAWVDFNNDGDWDDDGEQIFTDASLTAGVVNHLSFPVPGSGPYGCTYARFRVSTTAGLSYEGGAPDGEVEDYAVLIPKPGDTDLDGDVDLDDLSALDDGWDPTASDKLWTEGDGDGDGDVDLDDLSLLDDHWAPAGYLLANCGGGGLLVAAGQVAASDETSAHDAAVEEVFEQESDSGETSLGKWAWLCEYDQFSSQAGPPQKHDPAEAAVDKLLATYW